MTNPRHHRPLPRVSAAHPVSAGAHTTSRHPCSATGVGSTAAGGGPAAAHRPIRSTLRSDGLARPSGAAGAVLVAGVDEQGVEYVLEDDPHALPMVDPRYDVDDKNWVRYRTSWGGFLRLVIFVLAIIWVVTTAEAGSTAGSMPRSNPAANPAIRSSSRSRRVPRPTMSQPCSRTKG